MYIHIITYMHACMHTYIHTYIYIYIHIHAYTHIYTYTYIHIHMCVYIYIYIYIYICILYFRKRFIHSFSALLAPKQCLGRVRCSCRPTWKAFASLAEVHLLGKDPVNKRVAPKVALSWVRCLVLEVEPVVDTTLINFICTSAAPQPVSVLVLGAEGLPTLRCLCRALPDTEEVLRPTGFWQKAILVLSLVDGVEAAEAAELRARHRPGLQSRELPHDPLARPVDVLGCDIHTHAHAQGSL